MALQDVIQQLEGIYLNLMTKDLTPDEEAQAKVKLLELLSSVKAQVEVQGGPQAKNILAQTNILKDLILGWDPYGSAWFKEEKTLVDNAYNLLGLIKTFDIQPPAPTSTTSTINGSAIVELKQHIDTVTSSLKQEMANLQNEVAKIKKTVIVLANAIKDQMKAPQQTPQPAPQSVSQPMPQFVSEPAPQPTAPPTPKPPSPSREQRPISVGAPSVRMETPTQPRPVPIPVEKPESKAQDPISLPKPVPIPLDTIEAGTPPTPFQSQRPEPMTIPEFEPVQLPAAEPDPIPIPLDEPPARTPIPLAKPNFEEPIPLDEPPVEATAEPQLFGTLSASRKDARKKPDKEQLFSLFSGSEAPAPGDDGIELEIDSSESSTQFFSEGLQAGSTSTEDPETLYQELIGLEGKRYSIERSIRDLKTDRENGTIGDHEYKEKLSQFVDRLQKISKRIDIIREKID